MTHHLVALLMAPSTGRGGDVGEEGREGIARGMASGGGGTKGRAG